MSCGRGEFVLVDQAAEEVAAMYDGGVGEGISSRDRRAIRVRRSQVEGAVRSAS